MQQYTQPINFGISSYELTQWLYAGFVQDSIRVSNDLTLDLGLRYDRQTLTDATKNFAPRVGFGWHPNGDSRLVDPRRLRHVLHADSSPTRSPATWLNGLDGLTTYTATPGQTRLPDLPDRIVPAAVVRSARRCRRRSCRRATSRSRPGSADFYETQFAKYGLNFDLLPNYPDELREPAQPGDVDRRRARDRARACSSAPTTCISTGPTSIAPSI